MNASITNIRTNYTLKSFLETDVNACPITQFSKWWDEAITSEIDEANAMTLATTKNDNTPSARIVLLKDFSKDGFTFFTNYESAKANQISFNPNVALCLFWKELQRQIRIEGRVEKVSPEISDEYFNTRPLGSKIGAWASPQSKVIESREILIQNEANYLNKFGEDIKRPNHWGGYIVKPDYIEFWQGRSNRLHDRISYKLENNTWKICRLAP